MASKKDTTAKKTVSVKKASVNTVVVAKAHAKKSQEKDSAKKSLDKKAEGRTADGSVKKSVTTIADKVVNEDRSEKKINSNKIDDKRDDAYLNQDDGKINLDLDDDIVPVEDDSSDDDVLLEIKKKEISKAGYEKLILELRDLEENQIPSVNNRIKEAREFGDLSENAEYQSALSEKQMLETRISELKETIALSIVVDTNKASDTVQYGSVVSFIFVDTNESATVTIVGSAEITFEKKVTQISFDSPIGLSLEGKKVGDVCRVRAEKGRFDIKITSIK